MKFQTMGKLKQHGIEVSYFRQVKQNGCGWNRGADATTEPPLNLGDRDRDY